MRSFVKPFAHTKFGIAAASTAALIATPLVVTPANAVELFEVTNCNSSGPGSLPGAVVAANATLGADYISIVTSSDCTVTISNTMEVNEGLSIYNVSDYDFTLTHHADLDGPIIQLDEVGLISPASYEGDPTELRLNNLIFDGQNRSSVATPVVIEDSDFGGEVYIVDSTFVNSQSGAVAQRDSDFRMYVLNSTFTDNSTLLRGGAIYSVGKLSISDSYFANNAAFLPGGAVSMLRGELSVYDTTFAQNYSTSSGGAVYMTSETTGVVSYDGGDYYANYYYPSLTMRRSLFEGNTAVLTGGAVAFGGAEINTNPLAFISNVTFDTNYAGNRGNALYAAYSTVRINGYSVNYLGGDEYFADSPSLSSTFVDNTRGTRGGAIAAIVSDVQIQRTEFDGNEASEYGGAVYSILGSLGVTQSTFTANLAAMVGGAVSAIEVDYVYLSGNTFETNTAFSSGAVSVDEADLLKIDNNTFYNNDAYQYSALRVSGTIAEDSLLANNTFVDTLSSNASKMAGVYTSNVYVAANIFASPYDRSADFGSGSDGGANLSTSYLSWPKSRAASPASAASVRVNWGDLDLQPLTPYETFPGSNFYVGVVPLGPDSVALDYFSLDSSAENSVSVPERFLPWSFFTDGRQGFRFHPATYEPMVGGALDVGAFEYGALQNFYSPEPTPVDPNIVITGVSKPTISATGDSFSVYGRGLDDVTELFIAGVKVSFRVVSANELVVTSGVLPVGQAEILAIATDGRAVYQLGVGVVDEPSYWTKNLGNGQAKLYAKNIVGQGKVQFFLNGKEVAWINAIDESDPKLRKANGAAYLVRTVNLVAGKNRLEVKVDGVRVRFTTYKG